MKRIATLFVFLLALVVSVSSALAVDPTLNTPICNAPHASCTFPENQTISLLLTVTDAPSAPAENLQFRVADISEAYGSNPLGTFSIGVNEATWSYSPGFDSIHLNRPVTVTFEIFNSTDPSIDQVVKIITASDVNQNPVISDIANQNVFAGATRNIQSVITDGDDGSVPTSFSWGINSVPFLSSSELQISSSGLITIKTNATGVYTVTVTATDGLGGVDAEQFTLTITQEERLRIKDVTAVYGTKDDSVDDGDSFEATAGEALEFKVEVENLFSDDDDIDIEECKITITIENFDDGDDEKESSDRFTIKADDNKEETITFSNIPLDIDDGDHTITIEVRGENEDDNSIVYEDRWDITMEINKEDEDLKFSSLDLNPTEIGCERQATLSFTLENVGTDDADDDGVWVTIYNRDLGISLLALESEELDAGDDVQKNVVLNIPADRKTGSYPIEMKAFFSDSDYRSNDDLDKETVFLTIGTCGSTPTPQPTVAPTPGVIVVTPTPTPALPTPASNVPVVTYEESNSGLIVAGLIVGILIVVVLIIFLIVRLVK